MNSLKLPLVFLQYLIIFQLDQDEILSVEGKVVDTGAITDIRLARGLNDSSCLSVLSHTIDEILGNNDISVSKKETFINEIQVIVEAINKNNYSPTDAMWAEHEKEIRSAHTRALMGDRQDNNLGEVLATILLRDFTNYLSPQDKEDLRADLGMLQKSSDKMQKDLINQRLEHKSNKYSLLTHIYLFKIVGDNSNDHKIVARAECVYDELLNALDSHNIEEVNQIISLNSALLNELSKGGIDIGTATGIG
mgnify:CR=1 FL=1